MTRPRWDLSPSPAGHGGFLLGGRIAIKLCSERLFKKLPQNSLESQPPSIPHPQHPPPTPSLGNRTHAFGAREPLPSPPAEPMRRPYRNDPWSSPRPCDPSR
ncbi:hypothetical protein JTE90_028324 [Oedothorax gibbosus]|uniref:Uncharacterized protein n=1 Tax=Oedothorax gibbosus TaxID=931172 RepID=A0AAV6V216_9ARAC|nr:hypothetical protein JTE90_028324 [Oedothorax gibbosus]